jgi:hypothetical protein
VSLPTNGITGLLTPSICLCWKLSKFYFSFYFSLIGFLVKYIIPMMVLEEKKQKNNRKYLLLNGRLLICANYKNNTRIYQK